MTHTHRILGVSVGASPAEIRRAFRRLVLELHPDRSPTGDEARFLEVVEAYETLTGKARPRRRRTRSCASTSYRRARPGYAYTGTPYTAREAAPPGRFRCPRCSDSFEIEGTCPRCEVSLRDATCADASPAPIALEPEVEAFVARLEAKGPPPAWLGALERRIPVATIGSLLAGGSLVLGVHAPAAAMLIGYGLALLCADTILGRATA
jgi:hypothetical protein